MVSMSAELNLPKTNKCPPGFSQSVHWVSGSSKFGYMLITPEAQIMSYCVLGDMLNKSALYSSASDSLSLPLASAISLSEISKPVSFAVENFVVEFYQAHLGYDV